MAPCFKALLMSIVGLATIMMAAGDLKFVCYYSNWSQYRPGAGRFVPNDIDPSLCTHLIYSFANMKNNEITIFEWNDLTLYADFNGLKKKNSNLKTLLAVGGWNFGTQKFINMASSQENRSIFVKSVVSFLRKHNFDGLDLDWEYPADSDRGGRPDDKQNFAYLIRDLRTAFDQEATVTGKPTLLLTAAVAAGRAKVNAAYDIPSLNRYLDFINLMSYDFHGSWEAFTGHNSPLYHRPDEEEIQAQLNINVAAEYWVSQGASRDKLIIGMATYGRSFTLGSVSQSDPGDPAAEAGPAGEFTREAGFLAYYEVCRMLASGAVRHWITSQQVPYLVSGTTWVGYDDEESIGKKVDWVLSQRYGGAMVWNIDLDDFNQRICTTSSRPYPLMNLIKDKLFSSNLPTTNRPTMTTESPVTSKQPTSPATASTTPSGPTISGPTTSTTTSGPTTSTTTTSSTKTTEAVPNMEFCKGKDNGLYKYPADCSKYYHCGNDVTHIGVCGAGTLFNPSMQVCDWPKNVECADDELKPQDLQNFCSNKANGLYKYPDDCSQYYECVHEETYVRQCPEGTAYYAPGRTCYWQYLVSCSETIPENGHQG